MKSRITPQQAAQEIIRRDRAKESLLDYAKAIDIPGVPISEDPDEWVFKPVETGLADHHNLMLMVAEQVITGKIPRAMFFLPPGAAKSSYLSVVAPTWAMGKFPGMPIILASYGSDLAKKHGRKARQIVRSDDYNAIFETTISIETSAADEWATESGSSYLAGGILSGITGNRAAGLIIDDPVKGRKEADSEATQESTWEAYNNDLRTRLIPGGWEILVQTRWSDNDLSGKLLPEDYDGESGMIKCRDGREWYVLCIPAECNREDDPLGRDIGELLWPEWFTKEHFEGFKAQPRTWSALFQQSPAPEEGTYFQREWFEPNYYNPKTPPSNMNVYVSSDFGVTEDDGDDTEFGAFGMTPDEDLYMLKWWSGQKTADVWIDRLIDMADDFKPLAVFGEKGVIRRAIEPFLKKQMLRRKIFFRMEWINRPSNKVICARAFQGMASQGKVHLPDNREGRELVEELIRFPAGSKDNKVDVCALLGMAIDQAHPAIIRDGGEGSKSFSEKRIDDLEKTINADDPLIADKDISPWERPFHGNDDDDTYGTMD